MNNAVDNVENCKEPGPRVGTTALIDDSAKVTAQPSVLVIHDRQHERILAFEVLVESRLADPDVGENLIEADVSEAVAVEAAEGRIDQALAGWGAHVGSRIAPSR